MRASSAPTREPTPTSASCGRSFGDAAPVFDLILLGLGPDAHICSLFPGDAALGERERPARRGRGDSGDGALGVQDHPYAPVVNAAREVVFLVTGEDKAEAVARAFDGPPADAPHLVRPEPGSLRAVLDAAAARLLEEAGC